MVDNNKTLILQSYRTENVAPWIRSCLTSVKSWASDNNYRYEFIDDQLFDHAPQWVRQRCRNLVLPITDIARLYLIKDRLAQAGIKRVVWVDADVMVFSPEDFFLNPAFNYALSSELWVSITQGGSIRITPKINNSVMFFTRQQPVLDFFIFAAEEVIRYLPENQITSLSAGTALLSRLSSVLPMNIIASTATFSPPVITDIAQGKGPMLAALQSRLKHKIAAANLCSSLTDQEVYGVTLQNSLIEKAIERLLTSNGDIINSALVSPIVSGKGAIT